MLPEVGYFCLILLVILSAVQILLSIWGEVVRQPKWLSLNPFFSVCQMVLALTAFGALSYAFIYDDFTVRYVAAHSNSQLPTFFKIAATWGGHEGSMLFWLTMLSKKKRQ